MAPNLTPDFTQGFGKILAKGTLTAQQSTIFKCPGGNQGVITNITYFNTSGAVVTCRTFFDSLQFHQVNIPASSRSIIQDYNSPLFLIGGNVLQASASVAGAVNFFIWGNVNAIGSLA